MSQQIAPLISLPKPPNDASDYEKKLWSALSTQLNTLSGAVSSFQSAGTLEIIGETPTGVINGINVTFTLANQPGTDPTGRSSLRLFSDDVRVPLTEYTISGNVVTFNANSNYIPKVSLLVDYQ